MNFVLIHTPHANILIIIIIMMMLLVLVILDFFASCCLLLPHSTWDSFVNCEFFRAVFSITQKKKKMKKRKIGFCAVFKTFLIKLWDFAYIYPIPSLYPSIHPSIQPFLFSFTFYFTDSIFYFFIISTLLFIFATILF